MDKTKTKTKAIFFDRDGTLIYDKVYLNDPAQIEYLPQVFEALQLLKAAGFIFLVVTNQSGIAKGIVQVENLDKIHSIMKTDFASEDLELLHFYYAPFLVESNHPLRKPNPGMLIAGALDFDVDLKNSFMVGDRMSDVEAGHRAGCRSVLLEGTESPEEFLHWKKPDILASGILDAAKKIISLSRASI